MIDVIVTGGCSFSAGQESSGWTGHLSKFYKTFKPSCKILHTGYNSQGQQLIQKKIILTLQNLIDQGFNPAGILVLPMWSGTSRKAWYIDNYDIVKEIVRSMPEFDGGMTHQFTDLHDQFVGATDFFKTKNGSTFMYSKNGGWYFTVNGSETKVDFIRQHYLLDSEPNGVGKTHDSLENIVMLSNYCKLHGINLIHQFFMDHVFEDIEKHKSHQIIGYLYDQIDWNNAIKTGMFEYLHKFINVPKNKVIYLSHEERNKLDSDKGYFHKDGFHPGENGSKLYFENVLLRFLKNKFTL